MFAPVKFALLLKDALPDTLALPDTVSEVNVPIVLIFG